MQTVWYGMEVLAEATKTALFMKALIDKYVGKKAIIFLGGLEIEVEILDVKLAWGKERYEVKPVAGSGKVWVESITLID